MLKVTSERLTIGLVFVAVGVLACLAPVQSDTWWQLRAGLDIWRTHAVSLTETYSFTVAGQFWPHEEWLTELIFYVVYRTGGLPLLTAVCAAVTLGTWIVCWRLMRGAFEARFLVFVLCFIPVPMTFAIRPQVFSAGTLALTCALLAANRPYWLVPLFVIWANLHAAVALGVVVVFAATLAAFVATRRVPWRLVAVSLGCAAATLTSPLGWRLWPFIAESTERSRVDQLIEWLPPGASPHLWPFWAAAAALPALAVLRWRRLDAGTVTLVFIALAVLPLAIHSQRIVPSFLFAAGPALTAVLASGQASRPDRAAREHEGVNAALLGLGAVFGIVVVALAWRAPAPSLGWKPINPQAVAAIRACGEPMYNTYGDGGILIWFVPEKRVFIDNRQDPYPIDLLRAAHRLELDGDYGPLFAQYGIRCAVVPPMSPTAEHLGKDNEWARTYADRKWAVFARR